MSKSKKKVKSPKNRTTSKLSSTKKGKSDTKKRKPRQAPAPAKKNKKKVSKVLPAPKKKGTRRTVVRKKETDWKNAKPDSLLSPRCRALDKLARDKEKLEYEFTNYFNSEKQLEKIDHTSEPKEILEAYSRLIHIFASNHVREDVEIEDLVAEGQLGVCEAIKEYNDPSRKRPNYNFHQACLYKIRSRIFQYCLRNASQIKTPYYIQRGCMHVGQIFKLMNNQMVAEKILKRPGPATEEEIISFLYLEDERLPKKSIRFIKAQIIKKVKPHEFNQILSGILNHELGSRHSYVKNNLSDIGKILHIKEKLWYTATSNNMKYSRVIDLILSARKSKVELTPQTLTHDSFCSQAETAEQMTFRREFMAQGEKVCGETQFKYFAENKMFEKSYDEIAEKYSVNRREVISGIQLCIERLRESAFFQEVFNQI